MSAATTKQLGENRGGGMTERTEWTLDDAARARAAAALAVIDEKHRGKPECSLCGQRANRLDQYGLCSKTSEQHAEWRAGVRADERAGR